MGEGIINWYPGHMAKAKREVESSLKAVDVVIELVDARAPASSRNKDFEALFSAKRRVFVLNKADLADPAKSEAWLREFSKQGTAILFDSRGGRRKVALDAIARAAKPVVERYAAKGVQKTIRAMVAGIPNVGKSTFINMLCAGARAKTGDKPGVTKAQQWVRISPYLELLDTPGLLWPKLDDQAAARRLAYLGSIRDEILETEKLAGALLNELVALYPGMVEKRYGITGAEAAVEDVIPAICAKRGYLLQGGEADTERCANIVLNEFRGGVIGRVTLETPN